MGHVIQQSEAGSRRWQFERVEQRRATADDVEQLHEESSVESSPAGDDAESVSENVPVVTALITEVNSLRNTVAALQVQNEQLAAECAQLKKDNERLRTQCTFGVSFLQHDDMSVMDFRTKFLTGLPNFAAYVWLCQLCTGCLPTSLMLSAQDILLLILMKLKWNLKHQDLAWRFQISVSKVSHIINAGLPQVANQLKFMIRWPAKTDILHTMPLKFKRLYPNCRVIVDCTEIFIERASSLTARAMFYSHYKSHPTIKLLIGITPTGAVSFVSKAWEVGLPTK